MGNTDLLLSIIKLLEDKMNLDHDIEEGGVQLIILVEDNIRFYSSVLPELYKFVLQQSQEFATEALNEHQRTLRMRGRPKIALARTYEEATALYDAHPNNVLGVITDARYPRGGVVDPKAGVALLTRLRKADPFLPSSSSPPSRTMPSKPRRTTPLSSTKTPKRWPSICVVP